MRFVLALVASAAALMSQSASATYTTVKTPVVAFDFYGSDALSKGANTASATYTVSGVGLTIKALVGSAQGLLDGSTDGLGVNSRSFLGSGAISKGESLQFVFDQSVTLSSLVLAGWSKSLDHATLTAGSKSFSLADCDTGIGLDTFKFSNLTGTTFTLTGVGLLTSFRLAGLNIGTAVPEPATWGLMSLGLMGIAGLRRARRQS
jgi:hypothetical protein